MGKFGYDRRQEVGARNPRVHARFAITSGPGGRPVRAKSAESGKTYPGSILLGPRILALDSRFMSLVKSECYGRVFARPATRRRNLAVADLVSALRRRGCPIFP